MAEDVKVLRKYRRAMFIGRIAYSIWVALPTGFALRFFIWMLPSVGFYAYDDGFENHAYRAALRREPRT